MPQFRGILERVTSMHNGTCIFEILETLRYQWYNTIQERGTPVGFDQLAGVPL